MLKRNGGKVITMTAYRIEVDQEACVGDQLCCEIAPGTFRIGTDGKTHVVDPEGDPPQYILSAAKSCRLDAITLYDTQTEKKVWPRL